MKIIVLAVIRCSLVFTAVTALSVAYPASVQATTYDYTGNPFTVVSGAYTTSDFVSGMVTLADPLAPNMPLTIVRPTAFTFSDGMQTITNRTPSIQFLFRFATGPTGSITSWDAILASGNGLRSILTSTVRGDPRSTKAIYSGLAEVPVGLLSIQGQGPRDGRPGHGVYPIFDDADPYGVGSSDPAVPAGSGLIPPGLTEVTSWSATRPASHHLH